MSSPAGSIGPLSAADQPRAGAPLSAAEIADLLHRPAPTREQTAVIEAPLEPALVVAGAGSGKTETMAARVVWLIANGRVTPAEVLGLTFTRKAAAELAERVRSRLAQLARVRGGEGLGDVLDRPTIATYNSYAAGLVAEHALRVGMEPDSRLLTEASQWQLAAEVVERWAGDLDTDAAVSTVVGAVVALSGTLAEHLLDPRDAAARIGELVDHIAALPPGGKRTAHYAPIIALARSLDQRRRLMDLVLAYTERKRTADALDFADQVRIAARLAREVPAVGASERGRFRVVLLDEYQDTSYAQAELLAALFGGGHPVTAVGDPNQSIYGWRGASPSGLGRFPERFVRADGTPARVEHLSTSWRNDHAVLTAANVVAAPLRAQGAPVRELVQRPDAGPGNVRAAYVSTVEEEAAAVAEFVAARWRPGGPGVQRVSAAVLCRARSQFVPLEVALRSRGLPVEVVGLGGLLTTPEVVDVVALLEAAHDPSRGDSLMRLLTGPRINLGAADVHALGSHAADLVGGRGRRAVGVDAVDHRSIVDALDALPEPGVPAGDGRVLTDAAWHRLSAFADVLRELRASTYLSLPELVVQAERALGLDVEVSTAAALAAVAGTSGERSRAGRSAGPGERPGATAAGRGRAHLDAFRDVAANFAQTADTPTLGAFLAWLQAAGARERGLDTPVHEVDPDAVQLITVHAAKGLEWDVVAVPGLVDGVFPTTAVGRDGPTDSGWLTGLDTLPFPLRGDAEDLPSFDVLGARDGVELEERRRAFVAASGAHQVAEERRLAYVAFTRARRDLLLTGSWWRDGAKAKPPSPFLTELADPALRAAQSGRPLVDADAFAEPPGEDEDNPRTAEPVEGTWPTSELSPARAALRVAAAHVRSHPDAALIEPGELIAEDGADLGHLARVLLAEQHSAAHEDAEIDLPPHLSASSLIRLAADRDDFARHLRRPVPARPSADATRGTRFHLWAERYFTTASLLDPFDLPGEDDEGPGTQDLATLQESFLASEWAGRVPIAVEADVETPIGGVMIRCRIDAVFPEAAPGGGPGVVVVDWKTGRPPTDPTARRHREIQLAVYRLAWSRWAGVPLEGVSAAFFYVASGTTIRPQRLLDAAQIEALLRGPRPPGEYAGT